MPLVRPAIALDARRFGRGRAWKLAGLPVLSPGLAADLKLFGITFLGGFLFVSVLIA